MVLNNITNKLTHTSTCIFYPLSEERFPPHVLHLETVNSVKYDGVIFLKFTNVWTCIKLH